MLSSYNNINLVQFQSILTIIDDKSQNCNRFNCNNRFHYANSKKYLKCLLESARNNMRAETVVLGILLQYIDE